jgi:hypothetical protein
VILSAIINIEKAIWLVGNQIRFNSIIISWRSSIVKIIADVNLSGNSTNKVSDFGQPPFELTGAMLAIDHLGRYVTNVERLDEAKGKWVKELHSALMVYRTTPHLTTGELPFYLMYETKAVILMEIGGLGWRTTTP